MFIDVSRIPVTGNARIDQAHRDLAAMVNMLFEQWRDGVDGAELKAGFELFLRAVGRHFAEEEEIAAAAGCPNVPEHAGKHNALLVALTSHVHALADLTESRVGDRRIDLFSLIDQMLYEHEMLDDQEFWPVLSAVGHSVDVPADAPLIVWSRALETGHAEVDRQHRTLVELLNGLDAMVRRQALAVEASELLGRIIDHTRCHFQWEERQMAGIRAPGAAAHRMLHAQLLTDMTEAVAATGGVPTLDLMQYLKFWFIDHIRHVDGDLARSLNAMAAASARPGQAPSGPPGWSPRREAFAG